MNFFSIMFSPFSHPGILAGGTLIFFILGWLWYNPITPIGKVWTKYFPMPSKENIPQGSQIAVMILFQIFMGFVVTHTVMVIWELTGLLDLDIYNDSSDCTGICPGWHSKENPLSELLRTLIIMKVYLGFVLIKDLGHWYFEKKPFPLVLISVGYYFVGIMGVCGLLAWFL